MLVRNVLPGLHDLQKNWPDDWLHNTMELGERFNEDVLEVFEEWFENTALPAIMEKGGGEQYTMAATS
jgi:hypothetical protein